MERATILVVDDVISNTKLLVRLLERHGHTCGVARNGQDAIDTYVASDDKGAPFDTILMDYEMPRLNGPEAIRQIRDFGSDSFIVGVSGNVLPEDQAFFRDSGANAVLPKPVQFPDLEFLLSEYTFPERKPMDESVDAV